MTPEQVNKIIAEYMGEKPQTITNRVGIKITQYPEYISLDALFEPIMKIGKRHPRKLFLLIGFIQMAQVNDFTKEQILNGLAIATAKAIQELGQ